ncbi:MAG: hypothetical protein AB7S38_32195 [Vulcanimicrobiota bacterium]
METRQRAETGAGGAQLSSQAGCQESKDFRRGERASRDQPPHDEDWSSGWPLVRHAYCNRYPTL